MAVSRLEEEDWMSECIWNSLRSPDPFIRIGAVLVDGKKSKSIGRGWNDLPRKDSGNQVKSIVEWRNPNRSLYMIHAEIMALNEILPFTATYDKPILYTSGYPCAEAIKQAATKNLEKIVYGPGPTYATDRDRKVGAIYDKRNLISIVEFQGNLNCMRDKLLRLQDSFPDIFRNPKEK